MSIDINKLVGCKKAGNKTIAQCPACALEGADLHSKNHLIIFSDGRYGCVVDQSDTHSKNIWKLVGDGSSFDGNLLSEPIEPRIVAERTWPLESLERLVHDYSYWESRGISAATVEPFKGGVALTVGQLTNRWVFPMFDDNGRIIGFTGRALKPDMKIKWKILGQSSKFLWGGMEEIADNKEVILVESIGDSLALREHGFPNSLCLFGVNMSQAVLGYLIGANPNKIIISTNNDEVHEVGQKAALKIKNTLDKFFKEDKIVIKLPPVKDWGVATKEQIHESFSTNTNQEI